MCILKHLKQELLNIKKISINFNKILNAIYTHAKIIPQESNNKTLTSLYIDFRYIALFGLYKLVYKLLDSEEDYTLDAADVCGPKLLNFLMKTQKCLD
jgi:hypothetical protein